MTAATPLASLAVATPTVSPGLWRPPVNLPAIPLSESEVLWRDIWTNAVLVDPVLRPTYLPPSLDQVRRGENGHTYFYILYSDDEDQRWLMLSVSGGELARQPGSREEQVPVRDAVATLLLWNPEVPTGDACLCWHEPGSWGLPGAGVPLPPDHVPYCIHSRGFPKEEVIRVAEALRPVESLMAVPTRVPFLSATEGDLFWQQVAATATSLDRILRPTYLPSGIDRVWHPDGSTDLFRVVYSESSGGARPSVSAGPLNPALPGPNSLQQDVEVRGLPALYQIQDEADPLGSAFVVWEQPTTLAIPQRDHITYMVASWGLPKEELLKVGNALEPVEQ